MATTQAVTVLLVATDCYRCGITFGIEDGYNRTLKQTHQVFYCPNGHGQHYTGETDDAKRARLAEAEAARLRTEVARKDDAIAVQSRRATNAEHRARSLKGVATRLRNRAKHGVCPACTRTFANVVRHMTSKHPHWHDEADALNVETTP